jgi:excisionase family DNA binding protein
MEIKPPNTGPLMTIEDVATYLRLGKRVIYEMIKNKEIPCAKITNKWRFDKEKIDRWIEQHYIDQGRTPDQNKIRILVVDDEPAVTGITKDFIGKFLPETIVEATDTGIKALIAVGKFNPDIILLDIEIPEIDGIEICRRLKEDPESKHIKIIGISAYHDKQHREKIAKAGADDFIEKPFRAEQLISAIKKMILQTGKN